MTLRSFIKIVKHIAYQTTRWRPDAVCVSRKIFNDLSAEINDTIVIYSEDSSGKITDDAYICGLMVFVDDSMPDEYYQVGYMKQFIDYFSKQKKAIEGS